MTTYKVVGERLVETEEYVDRVIKEKEIREEELINKLGTLAEHYHKEKDKN